MLLASHIPKGFRVLYVERDTGNSGEANSLRLKQSFAQFNCPTFTNGPPPIDHLFRYGSLSRECADVLGKVIRILKIDGFLYAYQKTPFAVCGHSNYEDGAMVMTSTSWLNLPGADARVYTSQTKVDLKERTAIESQFLYLNTFDAIADRLGSLNSNYALMNKILMTKIPQEYNQLTSYNPALSPSCNSHEDCTLPTTLYFSNRTVETQITEEDLKAVYYPSLPKFFSTTPGYGVQALHWADLEGAETTPNFTSWLRNNLRDCGKASTAPLNR